jgi:hypothetical protein
MTQSMLRNAIDGKPKAGAKLKKALAKVRVGRAL